MCFMKRKAIQTITREVSRTKREESPNNLRLSRASARLTSFASSLRSRLRCFVHIPQMLHICEIIIFGKKDKRN